jgi:hypothetical protein
MALCQEQGLLPRPYDRLLFDEVYILDNFANGPTGEAAYELAHPDGYADYAALAFDFDCNPQPDSFCGHVCSVTWRPPNDNSIEDTGLEETADGTIPFYDDLDGTKQAIALSKRKIRYRYHDFETHVGEAFKVIAGIPQTTPSPFVHPNGEPIGDLTQSKTGVACEITSWARGPLTADDLNQRFQGTMNAAALDLGGGVGNEWPAYTVQFDVARTNDRIQKATRGAAPTLQYIWPLSIKLNLFAEPISQLIPAVGSYALDGVGNVIQIKDDNGFPIPRIPLRSTGAAAIVPGVQHTQEWTFARAVDYSEFSFA